jgi:hypothetical protein
METKFFPSSFKQFFFLGQIFALQLRKKKKAKSGANCTRAFFAKNVQKSPVFEGKEKVRSHCIYGAFTLDVKSVLIENLGGILGGMQC